MKRGFFVLLLALLFTGCATYQPGWASPLDEKLYSSQNYYKSSGRSDITCYIGPNPQTLVEDVICTDWRNVPAGAKLSPTRKGSSAYIPSTGGSVHVRGYYRKNGTYVRPHTRRAPRRR